MTRFRQKLRVEVLEARTLLSTCNVTRLTDLGAGNGYQGDLRYCITKANAEPGEDLIIFQPTAYGTIRLSSSLPTLTDDLIIAGPGAEVVDVRRDSQDSFRIFRINIGVTAQMYGLTISNGYALGGGGGLDSSGGGVFNSGSLTLGSCVIQNNVAESLSGTILGRGGGIYNEGSLTMFDSTVTDNAGVNSIGGGIQSKGSLTLVNTSFVGNFGELGGAVYAAGVSTVEASLFSNNRARRGAAIYGNASLLIERSSLVSNNAALGGAIYANDAVSVRNSTIAGNTSDKGGGIYASSVSVNLDNTTIANNTASFGGGLHVFSGTTLTINRSTISGNQVTGGSGSGIEGTVDVMRNAIVAGNIGSPTQINGAVVSGDYNIVGGDAKLGPLQDNGGPTLTLALLPGSPAIDAGDNTNAPPWDQRGEGFPRIVNGRIDIGAFEVQSTGSTPFDGGMIDPLTALLILGERE
jgi:predicted outer membrane repeat protein